MLARYRIGKAKYMKGGNKKVEYAKPPPGGFEIPAFEEKHNSMSAAIQDNADQNARAAQIQQEINQSGGVSTSTDLDPPPGTMEVEGSSVLNPEQNKVMTGLRELQMRSAADDVLDAPRPPKKGGARKKRKRSRKKRKRWPPKRKSRRRKKRKGGDFHISNPKLSDDMKRDILKRYHNVTEITKPPVWKPAKFTGAKKQFPLWMRHHFENEKKRGGKRKKRTRKKKRRRKKKTTRKRK